MTQPIEYLTQRQRTVYELHRAGMTYRVISERFAITPARARNIFDQALRSLRRHADRRTWGGDL